MANKSESEPQSTYEKVPWLSISLFRVSVNKITRDKRKEKKYMKLKRRLMMLALSATMLLSAVMVAQAAYSTDAGCDTIYSNDYDLSLYGYIDMVDGNWFWEDEYIWIAYLAGKDVSNAVATKEFEKVYANVYDDEWGCVARLYPYNAYRYISGSEKYGRCSDYGLIYMKCFDATGEIKGR